jgi:hypothetical protein
MPVLRKTINLTVSGNTLLAADSVTSLSTSDAGVQGEDEAVLFHVAVPTDWQDLSVRLKVMSQDGGYDLSDLPVANAISMPLRQGLTMASGRLTVSLIGSTTAGVRKSADCKTLIVAASAQEIDPISHIYPYPVRHITGSGGALVTQTDNETYNVNVTGTGGDMLQANYAKGTGQANANKTDHSIYSDGSGSAASAAVGSALETVIASKMPTATYSAGNVLNTNTIDVSLASKAAQVGSTLESILKTGWMPANETWTYASANTMPVAAGALNRYRKNDKLMWTQHGTVKYGVVITVADMLLTLAPNTDFTVENTGTYPITLNYYSRVSNPFGYPHWFNVAAPIFDTTTIDNGSGGQPTTSIHRIKIGENKVEVYISGSGTKVGASQGFQYTMNEPVPISSRRCAGIGNAYFAGTNYIFEIDTLSGLTYFNTAAISIPDNTVLLGFSGIFSYEI